jgi:hypothetical protein
LAIDDPAIAQRVVDVASRRFTDDPPAPIGGRQAHE